MAFDGFFSFRGFRFVIEGLSNEGDIVDGFAGAGGQVHQQLEFGGGQGKDLVPAAHFVGGQIDVQVAGGDGAGRATARASGGLTGLGR